MQWRHVSYLARGSSTARQYSAAHCRCLAHRIAQNSRSRPAIVRNSARTGAQRRLQTTQALHDLKIFRRVANAVQEVLTYGQDTHQSNQRHPPLCARARPRLRRPEALVPAHLYCRTVQFTTGAAPRAWQSSLAASRETYYIQSLLLTARNLLMCTTAPLHLLSLQPFRAETGSIIRVNRDHCSPAFMSHKRETGSATHAQLDASTRMQCALLISL